MNVYWIILLTVLTHTSYKGSKVLISLYALELGAKPVIVGLLFSMYAVFPVFLSVYAGKLSDRFGSRPPMLIGACGLFFGLTLPFMQPNLITLYASAMVIGVSYIFYIVAVQHVIGSFGDGALRTRNYSHFSIGVGITALLGPMITGFAIDGIGHRNTYLLLSLFPLLPVLFLLFLARLLPPAKSKQEKSHEPRKLADLFRNKPLRNVLITGGIIETGLELFNFFLPIYARSIGMTASQIGMIMGAYAVSMLGMRAIMPWLAKQSSEERLLAITLLFAAAVCALFPLVSTFGPLAGVAFLLGAGLGCGSPLSMILVFNYSPEGRSGEAIGVRQSINKATETVMPVIFGLIATVAGMGAVFWVNALMIAGGGAIMHRAAKWRARKTVS